MLKQLVKTVVPSILFRAGLDARERLRLKTVPRLEFDATRLRRRLDLSVDAAFHDAGIAADWREDHDAIRALFGSQERLEGINPGDRRALYSLIRAAKPKRVLEVGTHIGASTLYIARALRANGNGGQVTTVDILDVNDNVRGPWRSLRLDMPPREYATRLQCAEQIRFVVSDSVRYLNESRDLFDFVFLDGDHRGDTVYREISAALSRIAPDGQVLLHDYYPGGTALVADDGIILGPVRAVSRIRREREEIDVLPLGNLPWPTKHGSSATSLALLSRR